MALLFYGARDSIDQSLTYDCKDHGDDPHENATWAIVTKTVAILPKNLTYYIHNAHGDIVGIVDSADNLVVVYRYDKRGVYSMQMNDIMKKLCEESAYVSVYGDPTEVAKFKFGKFLCVGDFRTVMLLVSPNGDYDGIVVNNTEDVFRVDACGHYHEKMGKLINFCIDSVELPCIDKACIDLSILSFAKEREKIVSIELHDSGFADVVGFVDEVDEKVCRIHVIDEYGYDDSCSYVDLNSISQIVLDSEDERRIARLYQANLKL